MLVVIPCLKTMCPSSVFYWDNVFSNSMKMKVLIIFIAI